jgi:hypothetical protein
MTPTSTAICSGRIVAIDIPNRTLILRTPEGDDLELAVAPSCHVTLNGEPVRLRLLLAGDEAEAIIAHPEGRPTALTLDIRTPLRVR